MRPHQQSEVRLLRHRIPQSPCVVGVPIVQAGLVMDKAARTVPCHHRITHRYQSLELRASILGVNGKVFQFRWEVSTRMSDRSHAAVVKVDERSVPVVNGIMRSDQTNEAVEMDRVSELRQARNRSEHLIVSVAKRGAAIGRAADDTVNGKASDRVAKEEQNDLAASLAKGANRVNHAKASHIAARATRAAHQDQDGKSATDAAEAEGGCRR